MSNENNKSYRIRTNIGKDSSVNLNINQDFDMLEILSLKISTEDIYKLHTSSYGVVVGRVLANGGVGVPNAKISIFIEANEETLTDDILASLYPYTKTSTKNDDGIRYNLLPNEQVKQCHQEVGSFPNKCLVLDDEHIIEIFDAYYKFTTRSNNAGDYMIFGVPVGNQTIHMDVDLSDIGFLSQKPIDMMYKGYNITQFENASQFKQSTNLDSLPQIISQNSNVYVYPFWGDTDGGEIKITRNDIDVDYKFEPTCIFIGSMVTDDKSNGISKKCIPSVKMGRMDKLTTGTGTIEMIRKKPDGSVEEYPIMGTQLIDGNGTWCYQIPMNLDYITTDEYGNMVPTDDPTKGIATRTRVRFRVSLSDFESDYSNNHLTKILVPNNPHKQEDVDYNFGSATLDKAEGDGSFRDLLWNNVYTVKSYIPRLQKGNNNRTNRFTGFKNVNVYNSNNPIPYNNMRVNITFMFTLQCAIIKALIFFCRVYNWFLQKIYWLIGNAYKRCAYIGDGLCPDLEGWYFAPGCTWTKQLKYTLDEVAKKEGIIDEESKDVSNSDNDSVCLTYKTSYFIQCLEINLAMENEVIQFDFYNDWINGLLYIPRWMINIRKKRSYLFGLIKVKPRVQACTEENFNNIRRFTQQCALSYKADENGLFTKNVTPKGCKNNSKQKCHKAKGRKSIRIFGRANGGLVHIQETLQSQKVYYPKPCEWHDNIKCNFFATDIVLLGNINSCNEQGISNAFEGLSSSSFQLPPNLVQSNMDSDGMIFGTNGGFVCTGKKNLGGEGVKPVPQTFEDYINWSKGQDFYEKNPDDTEYEVTELSGIDWGLNGPNQGKNSLSNLYFPGGHFLGIACISSEVNIKSCVNLSRICELGAMMSQRQYKIVKKNTSDNEASYFEYVYLVPSGLISKDEISDTNFRNIFATLNHNRLKTEINKENGLRKYKFIPLTPTNFNGELRANISNKAAYNTYLGDESKGELVDAFVRTYEDNSRDYYYYRLGIIDENENIKEKYLINNGGSVSMPVYENSFYFYFGLKDGATAIDRFLSNYYAPCPKIGQDSTPTIKITKTDYEVCTIGKTGSVSVEVSNYPLPYSWEIVTEDGVTVAKETSCVDKIFKYDFNDKVGKYYVHVFNSLYGIDNTTYFIINKILPSNDETMNKVSFDVESFIVPPSITISSGGTVNISPDKNGGTITVKLEENENRKIFYKGFCIIGGGYEYILDNGADGILLSNCVKKAVEEKVINSTGRSGISNVLHDGLTLKVWSENDSYDIYGIFTCSNDDTEYDCVFLDTVNVDVLAQPLDFSIYDETLTLQELINKSSVVKISNNEKDFDYCYIDMSSLSSSTLTSSEKWKIKKAFMYNTSLYERSENSIMVDVFGGEGTPIINTMGYGENQWSDEDSAEENEHIYVSNREYNNSDEAEKDDYVLDINTILVPTKPWQKDNLNEEISTYTLTKNKFIDLKSKDKKSYYLTGSNSDNSGLRLNFKGIDLPLKKGSVRVYYKVNNVGEIDIPYGGLSLILSNGNVNSIPAIPSGHSEEFSHIYDDYNLMWDFSVESKPNDKNPLATQYILDPKYLYIGHSVLLEQGVYFIDNGQFKYSEDGLIHDDYNNVNGLTIHNFGEKIKLDENSDYYSLRITLEIKIEENKDANI